MALTLPATLETKPFPNGIAVDENYIYVVIGQPHASADSRPIPGGSESVVQVFSTSDGSLQAEIPVAGGGHSLRMTPDGRKIYIAHFSLDQRVTVINTDDLTVSRTLGGLLQTDISVPDALSISLDGRYVYVGNNGRTSGWVSRIDAITETVDPNWRIEVNGGFTCWIEVSPLSDVLYANSWTGGTVQRKQISSQSSEQMASVGAFPHAVVVDPSGAFLYALVSGGNRVVKLDGQTLSELKTIEGPMFGYWGGPVTGLLSRSGLRMFVANHAFGLIAVVDIDPSSPRYDTVIDTIEVGQDPIFQALSPDGKTLYVANNESSEITIVDVSRHP